MYILYFVAAELSAPKRLADDLLRNYGSPFVRPVRNHTNMVNVYFRASPVWFADFVSWCILKYFSLSFIYTISIFLYENSLALFIVHDSSMIHSRNNVLDKLKCMTLVPEKYKSRMPLYGCILFKLLRNVLSYSYSAQEA